MLDDISSIANENQLEIKQKIMKLSFTKLLLSERLSYLKKS